MARNAEKAMTTLARWRAAQDGGNLAPARRPFLATDCDDLRAAERWRNQVISEVARKVAQIQNAGLGEFRLRDLNDEINKLLREKSHWEARIRQLGGPDHGASGPRLFGADGQEVPGNRGYLYFGAAKELPGVRELFEQAPPPPPRRTRGDLVKHVDADYYGYRDDDDGVLVALEEEIERNAIKEAVRDYKRDKLRALRRSKSGSADDEADEEDDGEEDVDEDEEELETEKGAGENEERSAVLRYMAHVPDIPTQHQMEDALLERKKREILRQILGDD